MEGSGLNPKAARGVEVVFVPNRELRIVPAAWSHPRDDRGRYVPVFPEEMPAGANQGQEPMVVAYETDSEGTPISPRFPDTPEGRAALIAYCAEHCTTFGDHKAGAEAWAAILFGKGAAVTADGVVIAKDD